MSLALCSQVVSQASQHFRSSEKQAISEGCFARQSICSVVSLYSGMRMTRYLPTSNDASLVFTSTLLISFFLLPISPVKLCRPSPRHPPPPSAPSPRFAYRGKNGMNTPGVASVFEIPDCVQNCQAKPRLRTELPGLPSVVFTIWNPSYLSVFSCQPPPLSGRASRL